MRAVSRFLVFGLWMTAGLAVVSPGLLRAQELRWSDTFDFGSCGWGGAAPMTLTFDPTQDDSGNGGGSCRSDVDCSQDGVGIGGAGSLCCFCFAQLILDASNFVSLDFDVKWNSHSTVSPSEFNASPWGLSGMAVIAGGRDAVFGSESLFEQPHDSR